MSFDSESSTSLDIEKIVNKKKKILLLYASDVSDKLDSVRGEISAQHVDSVNFLDLLPEKATQDDIEKLMRKSFQEFGAIFIFPSLSLSSQNKTIDKIIWESKNPHTGWEQRLYPMLVDKNGAAAVPYTLSRITLAVLNDSAEAGVIEANRLQERYPYARSDSMIKRIVGQLKSTF